MKKKTFFSLFAAASLLISTSYAFADSTIAGWWKVAVNFNHGDFVTGEWATLQTSGPKSQSYLYISLTGGSSSGEASFIEWDGTAYSLENTYAVYIKNNVIALIGPSTLDLDGNPVAGSSIVLKTSGNPYNVRSMKGYYTKYDIDDEQFVGMGSLHMSRASLQSIPEEVKLLIP